MESNRMKITDLGEGIWLLDDNNEATCYLVCGTEKAMLIDTVNGHEDLHAIVRTITDLPLIVVNTHGHCDHIYGNPYFDEAWMHPDDEALARLHFTFIADRMAENGLTPCPFRWLSIGQVFDLGDVSLEVIDLKGHTAGSIGLLDRKHRTLFSGDGCNPHIWMQLEESQPLAVLHETLVRLVKEHGAEFDRVLFGHANPDKIVSQEALVPALINAVEAVMSGHTENDIPYHYHAGECRQHPFNPDNADWTVVYDENKL